MKNVTDEFGQSAGKVWRAIYAHGSLEETKLMKTTRLDRKKLSAAIGWLARENKICKNDNFYILGKTNLTDKIGVDAGKIWSTLNVWGEVDVSSIAKLAEMEERDAYSALGWLAREDKIQAKMGKTKEHQMKFRLK